MVATLVFAARPGMLYTDRRACGGQTCKARVDHVEAADIAADYLRRYGELTVAAERGEVTDLSWTESDVGVELTYSDRHGHPITYLLTEAGWATTIRLGDLAGTNGDLARIRSRVPGLPDDPDMLLTDGELYRAVRRPSRCRATASGSGASRS